MRDIDLYNIGNTNEEILQALLALRRDFDAHIHDGVSSKSFETIRAETFSGRAISIKKTSYTDTVSGLWTGLVGAIAKLNLGDATTYLKWDGSALTIGGNATFSGTLSAAAGTLGAITIGTNAWHVDSSGNMWWGASTTYAGATIKISSAGSIDFTTGTFSGTLSAASGTLGAITIGTNAWHVDSSGNMWWGNYASYATATYKISVAGVANLSGLVVGTNVELGIAQDSAGVTTIIGNTVTTGYINALAITVLGAVTAGSLSGITVTGGTIQTATSGQRVVILGSNNTLSFYDSTGTLRSKLEGSGLSFYDSTGALSGTIIGSTGGIVTITPNAGALVLAGALNADNYLASKSDIVVDSDNTGGTAGGLYVGSANIVITNSRALQNIISATISGAISCTTLNTTSGAIYYGADIVFDMYAAETRTPKNFVAATAGSQNLGSAGQYWNDVSYKTLTDRGCLGWFDEGVELQTGKKVSDLEALKSIQKHPVLKTAYGIPRFDYKTMPKAVYKKAEINGKVLSRDENDKPYFIDEKTKEKKYAEDGAELTALVSIMIGAIKELDKRIEKLEND